MLDANFVTMPVLLQEKTPQPHRNERSVLFYFKNFKGSDIHIFLNIDKYM